LVDPAVPEQGCSLGDAEAIGASAIAPPIAAAVSHGAMYLIVVFMMFALGCSRSLVRRVCL
jgi:hypothetical protein